MVTCYDFTMAQLLNHTGIDCLLVGDSVAMTMHGFATTVSATLTMMVLHTRAVSRGASEPCIVSDLPFLSYRKSLTQGVTAAQKLMQAGAHAIKLEGARGNLKLIAHLVESGVPVMGHLGLTPQHFHALGGYKVQCKTRQTAQQLQNDAQALEEAGCFAVVLECIPWPLAQTITETLKIATIGIGAGRYTDGQVLVIQDLLGLNPNFKPKFVKHFMHGAALIQQAIAEYRQAIASGTFPHNEHSYSNNNVAPTTPTTTS